MPELVDPQIWDTNASGTFPLIDPFFELTSGEVACIDMSSRHPSNEPWGSLTVTIESVGDGAKKSNILFALVKDSHPGDHCGTAEGEPGSALNLNLMKESTGTINDIPAATVDACGTGFSEAGPGDDGTPDPLVVMLAITGGRRYGEHHPWLLGQRVLEQAIPACQPVR
jgi:hypothetical protein